MSSPIDPLRRTARVRRAAKARSTRAEAVEREVNLPVVVDAAPTVSPRPEPPPPEAAFEAQLLGQEGQKRGLRAGPELINTASTSYNRAKWSGSKDRRSRKGANARTEI